MWVPHEAIRPRRPLPRLALRGALPAHRRPDPAHVLAVHPTYEAAKAFGATTDTLLTSALVLNAALPATGLLLAWLARERFWRGHFAGAVAMMPAIYVAVAIAAAEATAPLIGHVPSHPTPRPEPTHCIPIIGGRGC